MSVKKTFGGDRLGTGAGFTVNMRAFERTTHDLGNVFRSNMGVGIVMPTYCDIVKRGDVWDKEISQHIITHPTNGPIFGSYECRTAVFTADMRLYNKLLHNKRKAIGLEISRVKWPMMQLNGPNIDASLGGDLNAQQINQTSLLATTGVRGLGTLETADGIGRVNIYRNALMILVYYEIISNYIANKQEEIGFVITATPTEVEPKVNSFFTRNSNGADPITYDNTGSQTTTITSGAGLVMEGSGLVPRSIQAYTGGVTEPQYIEDIFDIVQYNESGTRINASNRNGRTYTILGRGISENKNGAYFFWDGTNQGTFGNGLELAEFELEAIERMRDAIFAQPETSPLILTWLGSDEANTWEPELPYTAVVGQTNAESGEAPEQDSKLASWFDWAGLCVATYKADRWQTWLNKEWVESANSMSDVAITEGSFSMDALSMANRIWKLNNDIIAGGGDYEDWLTAVDGLEMEGASETPVYRGGCSCMITFDEVVSSSEAGDQPLGTLGGQGVMKDIKGGTVRFKAQENGMIMAVTWITPMIDYYQGNKWFTKLETLDDLHKPIFDAIGYQDKTTDQIAAWDTKIDAEGNETFFAVGKEPAWTEYWTRNNEVYGSFTRENDERYQVLLRDYTPDENARIEDLTTYIDPTKFLYPFAYTGLEYGPFWVQLGFKTTARRIMSGAKQPQLIRQ